jgi:hypothetical protein
MHNELSAFITDKTVINRTVSVPVKTFLRAFREWLPPRERFAWDRTRLISEIAGHFSVIKDSHGLWTVSGLALSPTAV